MQIRSTALSCAGKVYKVYRVDFNSLTELEVWLSEDPEVNEKVFPSPKSAYMPESFAGAPLDEAIRYCHGGYTKGFPMFMQLKKELERANVKAMDLRRSVPAVVGARPNVPNFVAGTPKTMYRLDRAKEKKFVDVMINLAYPGDTTEEQIRNRGILTLNLISLFEQNHMGVNLYVFEASFFAGEIFLAEIRLKRPGEATNVGKCYYPLCGKEFVRRLLVRVKESMPFREKWGIGYGGVLPEEMLRQCMNIKEGTIVIGPPDELGIQGKNIYQDADAFFEHLELKDEIRVVKYAEYLGSKDHPVGRTNRR